MDTSSPAIFVNGESLQMYVGKKVRSVVQVIKSDGGDMIGKSTDEHQWTIKGLSSAPLMSYVEVIGVAESNQSICAELWTDFGKTFDAYSYNQLCQLANGEFKALFL
ncbi:hypothetical protein P3X46_022111 [Hevea brasiliensis]|uniref:Replication protein A 14 kDa subunit B-like n=1 Tax=Hevea brasiliensis TaxID=3981 RepID=A0ABQ9LIZ7_HEVBR|nr:replication protein A 14 kDa subunit B [Hevea brasiliensis]XP_021681548.1 replication protein A 14 kDa subunit B [Hevea brasiliensis]KAJ9167460.1 hypothetical protein P3X46_022111 [Hevea brasiliensis]